MWTTKYQMSKQNADFLPMFPMFTNVFPFRIFSKQVAGGVLADGLAVTHISGLTTTTRVKPTPPTSCQSLRSSFENHE